MVDAWEALQPEYVRTLHVLQSVREEINYSLEVSLLHGITHTLNDPECSMASPHNFDRINPSVLFRGIVHAAIHTAYRENVPSNGRPEAGTDRRSR